MKLFKLFCRSKNKENQLKHSSLPQATKNETDSSQTIPELSSKSEHDYSQMPPIHRETFPSKVTADATVSETQVPSLPAGFGISPRKTKLPLAFSAGCASFQLSSHNKNSIVHARNEISMNFPPKRVYIIRSKSIQLSESNEPNSSPSAPVSVITNPICSKSRRNKPCKCKRKKAKNQRCPKILPTILEEFPSVYVIRPTCSKSSGTKLCKRKRRKNAKNHRRPKILPTILEDIPS